MRLLVGCLLMLIALVYFQSKRHDCSVRMSVDNWFLCVTRGVDLAVAGSTFVAKSTPVTGLEFLLGKQMPYVLIGVPTRSAGRRLDISVGCQFSQSIRPSADDLTIPMPFGRVLDDWVEVSGQSCIRPCIVRASPLGASRAQNKQCARACSRM